ncbi:MAG TPA: VWA domain-containing protein [Thermoanaerobacterales bacterium]|nr:VWA domain-containing protein [Thermoanaerobacterales bacterium]
MDNGMINQIILVTDGQSNIGGDPALAAYEAASQGIIVNAIGIIDPSSVGMQEIKDIAKAGNGQYQLVQIEDLASSMVLVTHQSVQATLEQIVSSQLKQLIGSEVGDISPKKRGKVFEFIERLQDEIALKCLILTDTSGSMSNKLQAARESIISLFKSLEIRSGKNLIGVMSFPNGSSGYTKIISPFTDNCSELEDELLKLQPSGNTPTAPALRAAISYFLQTKEDNNGLLEQFVV